MAPAFRGNFHQPLIHWVGLQLISCFRASLPNCPFHGALKDGPAGWDSPSAFNGFGSRIPQLFLNVLKSMESLVTPGLGNLWGPIKCARLEVRDTTSSWDGDNSRVRAPMNSRRSRNPAAQDGIFGVQHLALSLCPVCDVGVPRCADPPSWFLGRKLHFGVVAVFSGTAQRKVHVHSHAISKYSSEKPFRMKGALQINSI